MKTATCPEAIRRMICGKEYAVDEIGMSGAEILLFDDCVLKTLPYRKENDDTVEMMRWLSGRLPVPEVLCYEHDSERQYLLMRKLPGRMACDPYYLERPQELVALLAQALRMLWRVDVSDCPRKGTVDAALRQASYRVEHGLVDPASAEPTTFGERGFQGPQALLKWLEEHRPSLDPVLSHGDFCLPNLFLSDGRISGFVDLGKTGVGDRWNDIALCYRSLKHNSSGAYGGKVYPGIDPDVLFEALGLAPDWEKLKYYTLLDELM